MKILNYTKLSLFFVRQPLVLMVIGLLLAISGCNNFKKPEEGALARVYNQVLYPSDIEGLVRKGTSKQDSILMVQGYIENWARDKMMLNLAKKNMPDNVDIVRLVEDYRSGLILNSYKEVLLKKQEDTTVTMADIKAYYQENKANYPLEEPIFRGIFIKIDRDAEDVSNLKRWWKYDKDKGVGAMGAYIANNAESYILDDKVWTPLNEVLSKTPDDFISMRKLRSTKEEYLKDSKYRYFLMIKEVKLKNDPSPLSYVQNNIAKILVRKKRIQQLNKLTEEAFKREIENNNIEIF